MRDVVSTPVAPAALPAVASVLATIPVWIPTFPPMTDLPQHAAQVALLREMLRPDFVWQSMFHINWFTPYLLGYMLVYVLTPAVGMVAACKIVIATALASLPPATALVMRETGTDRRWALLTIPAMYGFSYHWGFLNFLVAAPLGLVFVWLTLRQARMPTWPRAIGLGVTIIALFFCHALICAFFGLIAGLILLFSGTSIWNAIRRVLPLTAVLPIMFLWASHAQAMPIMVWPSEWNLNWFTTDDAYYSTIAQWTTPGGWGWGRTAGLFPRLLGILPGAFSTIAGLTFVALPFAAGARCTRRLRLWIPFLVCLAMVLFAPGFLFGTDFIYQRFTVFLLPLFLITLQQPADRPWPRWTWPVATLLVAGWIGVVSTNVLHYEAEAAGFDAIVGHMEPAQRALGLEFERDSRGTIAPPFLHFASWYSALKGGVVDPNFAGTHVQLVLYKPEARPPARLGFEWVPRLFDWNLLRGGDYRYFVVKAEADHGPWIFGGSPCGGRLVHHVNHWWLYERNTCGPRP